MFVLRIVLLFVGFILPSFSCAKILEFPFSQDNKNMYYLDRSTINQDGVETLPQNSKLDPHSSEYTFISFDKNQSNFHNIALSNEMIQGKKSGAFFNSDSYVDISFSPSLDEGFFIDFLAKPISTIRSKIFSIDFLSPDGIQKTISIMIDQGRMKIQFQNMFINAIEPEIKKTLTLYSDTKIFPNTWARHRITYTAQTGEISYSYNNIVDKEIWATDHSLAGGSVFYLDAPENPRMILGEGYRGLMNNFLISSNNASESSESQLVGYDESIVITRVIDLQEKSRINLLDLDSNLPKDTGYMIKYRISDSPFNENTPTEVIPWKEYNTLHPQKNIPIIGTYLQASIYLFADPNKNFSPRIKKLLIDYSSFEIPFKPIEVIATSSNNDLTLSFHHSLSQNITSYRIYFGTSLNSFSLGEPEKNISSPLNIPVSNFDLDKNADRLSYSIKGLIPHKIYYLKVKALTNNGIESDFSDIVKIRVRDLE